MPLLSYILDDMWRAMLKAGDGVLRFPAQSIDLGRVLVERADRFLAERPGAEDALRRTLTLKLATVREDGDPRYAHHRNAKRQLTSRPVRRIQLQSFA